MLSTIILNCHWKRRGEGEAGGGGTGGTHIHYIWVILAEKRIHTSGFTQKEIVILKLKP